jgi:hypothetical protein
VLDGLEPVTEVAALIDEAIVDDPPAQATNGGLIAAASRQN